MSIQIQPIDQFKVLCKVTFPSPSLVVFFLFSVNVRLLGERLEQNEESKPNQSESQQARWPSSLSCPACWRNDGSWEQEEVFNHLHNMYWSGNPSYIKLSSSDNNSSVLGGGGRSQTPLRWKLTLVIFMLAMLVRHMYNWKRRKLTSGQHKK